MLFRPTEISQGWTGEGIGRRIKYQDFQEEELIQTGTDDLKTQKSSDQIFSSAACSVSHKLVINKISWMTVGATFSISLGATVHS